MRKKLIIIIALGTILFFQAASQSAQAAQNDEKIELLEQALIQQLHPVIYQSLQNLYHETYPQFVDIKIVHIESYVTGTSSSVSEQDRKASAAGGAKVFSLIVQVTAIHHHELVQIFMNNEAGGSTYTVTRVKTSKY